MTRHPGISEMCSLLDRVIVGRAAAAALENMPSDRSSGHLFVMPSWAWAHSRIDVGRKDRNPAGGRYLLPVRLTWYPSPVVVVQEGSALAGVLGVGLGTRSASTVQLDPESPATELVDGHVHLPRRLGPVASGSMSEIERMIESLSQEGNLAYWEALARLETKVTWALSKANVAAGLDIYGGGMGTTALDETSMESLRDSMVYGDGDKTSPVQGLVERGIKHSAFAKVDPEMYFTAAVSRDARAAIRRALGDPHIGSKVRRLAREQEFASLDELIAEYRRLYPADRLSYERAEAALRVTVHPNATTISLDERLAKEVA